MAKFDPYRKWLGIAPEEQPPNLYRLLGIGLFESDPDVISNAADRQMAHIRTYQTGKHSDLSQDLLNELAAAQLVLLDGGRRAAYDKKLRAEGVAAKPVAPAQAPPIAKAVPIPTGTTVPVADETDSFGPQVSSSYTGSGRSGYSRRRKKQSAAVPLVVGGGVLAVVVIIALVAMNASKPTRPRRNTITHRPTAGNSVHRNGNRAADSKSPKHRRPAAKKSRKKRNGKKAGSAASDGHPPSPAKADPGEIRSMKGHTDIATSVVVSPSGPYAVSGGFDKSVRLWDLQDGEDMRTFTGSKAPVLALDFSSDGKRVLASTGAVRPPSGGMLHIWDAATGRVADKLSLVGLKVAWDTEFSPDGKIVVAGCEDGTVRLFDVSGESEVLKLQGHKGRVRSVAFSPGGDVIVSGGADGTVRLWNRYNGQPLHTMTGHTGPVTGVAFSPDGKYVVSGGSDKTVRYWDTAAGRQIRSCAGHTGAVNAVAHAPDAPFALSGGNDGTIRLWDLTTGREVACFKEHEGPIRSVAFSERRGRAVSAGDDRTVRLWQLPDLEAESEIAGGPISAPKSGRDPLPNRADQKAAIERIKNDEFKLDFAGADRPSKRLALAKKLLAEGAKSQDDPARTYALLRLVWNDATEFADPELALAAVDEIGKRFEIDTVGAKATTLASLAKKMRGSAPARKRDLTDRALAVLDEAVAANDPEAARKLVATAQDVVAGIRDREPELAATVDDRARQIENRQGVPGGGIQQILQKLENNPDDPKANLEAGKYYCFELGDWSQGLPKLAASSDRKLRPLARAELAKPQELKKRLDLADRWWDVAEGQPGDAKKRVREHAAGLYQAILPELDATEQFRVQLRIQQVGGAAAPALTPDALPAVGGFECREENARKSLLAAYGGTDESEAAVRNALKWLAEHQHKDGHWSFDHETPKFQGKAQNRGSVDAANAATALALLPFLAAGNGPRDGEFRRNVATGVNYLRDHMAGQGNVGTLHEPGAKDFPSHALGTMALCEASAAGGDRQVRAAAGAAVNFIVMTQNSDGGWGRVPKTAKKDGSPSNMACTGWNLAALKTAGWARLPVPQKTIRNADKYIRSLRMEETFGYLPDAEAELPSDHAAMIAMTSKTYLGAKPDNKDIAEYVKKLGASGPSTQGHVLDNFFNTQLMRDVGGDRWKDWNESMRDYLVTVQMSATDEAGSWFFRCGDSLNRGGGRLYCTAVAALILETYYRNPPPKP